MCVEMKSKPFVRISGTEVRAKEVILVCLALALLVFSITLFFKNWRKNYWDINQLPYYAYLYKVGIHTTYNTCINTGWPITKTDKKQWFAI